MKRSRGGAFTATMARHFMICAAQNSDIVRSALTHRTAHVALRRLESRGGAIVGGRPVSRCIRLCRRPPGWLPVITIHCWK